MTGKRRAGRAVRRQNFQPPIPTPPASDQTPFRAEPLAPRKTRRELRAERRRMRRRRIGTAGIVGIIAAVAVAAVAGVFTFHQVTSGSKSKPGQTTLLFSITDPTTHQALDSALLAHDARSGHRAGVELLIPSRVLTEVCGFGDQQFGHILGLPDGARVSRTATSDLLDGVTVDGSWVLTTQQLSRLVDQVGGITADVDVNVVKTLSDGTREVVIPRGNGQHLNGQLAALYATYVASANEDQSANLVRLQNVIDGLLAALPRDAAQVASKVSSLGPTGASTLGASKLGDLLVGLAADERSNAVLPQVLPVVKIDTGGPPSYRPDDAGVKQLVETNLGASWPASARKVRTRVFVQNGVGTPGLAESACSKLTRAGYAFAGSGNAAHFGYTTSKVIVFTPGIPGAELGDAVARALGLSVNDVRSSQEGQNIADVVVIIGKDYKP